MNPVRTFAEPCQGLVWVRWTAQRLDPVCVVILVLDHSTDVDQLKGALVQQSVCVGWKKRFIESQQTKLKAPQRGAGVHWENL